MGIYYHCGQHQNMSILWIKLYILLDYYVDTVVPTLSQDNDALNINECQLSSSTPANRVLRCKWATPLMPEISTSPIIYSLTPLVRIRSFMNSNLKSNSTQKQRIRINKWMVIMDRFKCFIVMKAYYWQPLTLTADLDMQPTCDNSISCELDTCFFIWSLLREV